MSISSSDSDSTGSSSSLSSLLSLCLTSTQAQHLICTSLFLSTTLNLPYPGTLFTCPSEPASLYPLPLVRCCRSVRVDLDVGLAVLCAVTFVAWLKLRHDTHDIGEQLVHHYEAVHEEHEASTK